MQVGDLNLSNRVWMPLTRSRAANLKEIPQLWFIVKYYVRQPCLSGCLIITKDHRVSKQAVLRYNSNTPGEFIPRQQVEGWKKSDWSCPQRRWSHLYFSYGTLDWRNFSSLIFIWWITASPICHSIPHAKSFYAKGFKRNSHSQRDDDERGFKQTVLDSKNGGQKNAMGSALTGWKNSFFNMATYFIQFFQQPAMFRMVMNNGGSILRTVQKFLFWNSLDAIKK